VDVLAFSDLTNMTYRTIPGQKVELPFTNNIAHNDIKGVEKFYGQWSATVTKGTLDPQKVRNIVLILTYDGDLKWNV